MRAASVDRTVIVTNGGLLHDREFALFDERGAYVNAKRDPRVHSLGVEYDDELNAATFSSATASSTFVFAFDEGTAALERWLETHFEQRIFVRRNTAGGFPDDAAAPGPTIVSTATLATVASWFPELDVESARDRFRANIELDGVPAFWEDCLFGEAGETVSFHIGDVRIDGTNPCARCIVPSRDANTGDALHGFAKTVAQRRAATLPAWANRARFDHYYRIAVNTRLAPSEAGKTISLSDRVETQAAVAATSRGA